MANRRTRDEANARNKGDFVDDVAVSGDCSQYSKSTGVVRVVIRWESSAIAHAGTADNSSTIYENCYGKLILAMLPILCYRFVARYG